MVIDLAVKPANILLRLLSYQYNIKFYFLKMLNNAELVVCALRKISFYPLIFINLIKLFRLLNFFKSDFKFSFCKCFCSKNRKLLAKYGSQISIFLLENPSSPGCARVQCVFQLRFFWTKKLKLFSSRKTYAVSRRGSLFLFFRDF